MLESKPDLVRDIKRLYNNIDEYSAEVNYYIKFVETNKSLIPDNIYNHLNSNTGLKSYIMASEAILKSTELSRDIHKGIAFLKTKRIQSALSRDTTPILNASLENDKLKTEISKLQQVYDKLVLYTNKLRSEKLKCNKGNNRLSKYYLKLEDKLNECLQKNTNKNRYVYTISEDYDDDDEKKIADAPKTNDDDYEPDFEPDDKPPDEPDGKPDNEPDDGPDVNDNRIRKTGQRNPYLHQTDHEITSGGRTKKSSKLSKLSKLSKKTKKHAPNKRNTKTKPNPHKRNKTRKHK
jgi:hypothetical protein